MKDLTKLTDAEKEALASLLYLATHDEAVNTAIRASYSTARAGNPDMMGGQDFSAQLDNLYVKSCK
jgi:hypothetical protein